MDERESLIQQLEELKSLRERLTSVEKAEELDEYSADIREYLKDELEIIDNRINEIEAESKVTAKEYEESQKRLQTIIDEYEKIIENTNLLSEDELYDLKLTNERMKLEENERSNEIKRRFEEQKKLLTENKKNKTRILNNIKNSEALGLTWDEYKKVTSTLKNNTLMDNILIEKGLSSIIEKNRKDLTKEEQQKLKEAKQEVLKEISEFKNEHDDYSTLETIEALYSLETEYKEIKKPEEMKVSQEEIKNIETKEQELAHKVVDSKTKTNEYEKEETPVDMENAEQNEKVDINDLKPAEEKVTLFKDNETADYYVRKYAVDRFKLKSADLGSEQKIYGSVCYKISEHDVDKIKENANNEFAPYIVDEKEVTLNKPRDRRNDEKDEEYVTYLKDYYNKEYPEEVTEKDNSPRDRRPDETDEEYNKYLEDYYGKTKPTEEIEEYEIVDTYEKSLEGIKEKEEEAIEIELPNDGIVINVEDDKTEIEDIYNNELDSKEEEISDIYDEELSKVKDEETTEEKEEVVEEYNPEDIKASEEFKKELKQGNVLYNIVHSVPKLAKKLGNKIKDLFEPDHQFDEMEEDKPKQR